MDTKGPLRVGIFVPSLLVQQGIILLTLVGTVVLIDDCSRMLNFSTTTLTYERKYDSYFNCYWKITAAEGFVPVLRFHTMKNPPSCPLCQCNYVDVLDSPDESSSRRTKFCVPELSPFYASQNRIIVRYRVLYSRVRIVGFTATVSEEAAVTQDVHADNGTIHSPNYPNNYDPDKRYAWKITVPKNHQIFLEFLTFDLPYSSGCSKDSVQIIDSYQMSSPVSEKFCGTNVPKYMKSSGDVMFIVFQSDSSQESQGFLAEFRKVEKCEVQIVGTSGNITSPNYPNNYGPLERCRWTIIVPENHRVLFRFLTFNVSNSSLCTKDGVKIYDGIDRHAPEMGTFCGSRVPSVRKSASNKLLVVFESDTYEEYQGFSAIFEADLCGEEFNSDNGTFHSPNYPGEYGTNEWCSWKITVQDGYRVALRFDSLKIHGNYGCTADSVTIFDGLNASRPIIQNFCQRLYSYEKIYSSGNSLSVRFVTDAFYQRSGFSVSFTKAQIPPSGNTTNGTSQIPPSGNTTNGTYPYQRPIINDNGTITSIRYPELYPPDIDYLWEINSEEGTIIRLEFQSFDVEYDEFCSFDFVQVWDGNISNGQIWKTYCGDEIPEVYWCSGNAMTLRLHTDASFEHTGFSAFYSKVKYKKEILNADSGILTSPNFPNNYSPLQMHVWEIIVPIGNIILLRFLSFELEYSESCSDDFVRVIVGDEIASGKEVRTYCGATIPHDIRSSSNNLTVVFATDSSEELRGFSAKFEKEVKCGNTSCRNGGTCIRASRRCVCKHGYTGPLCDEKIKCSDDTCEHEGSCFQNETDGLFYCVCAHGYVGVVCHERILCGRATCENGGTCTHRGKNGTVLCACAPGFEGLFCEKDKSSGRVVAVVVPSIIVLMIASAVILFLLMKRRLKQQKSLIVQAPSSGSQLFFAQQ